MGRGRGYSPDKQKKYGRKRTIRIRQPDIPKRGKKIPFP